jgi:endonuclease I
MMKKIFFGFIALALVSSSGCSQPSQDFSLLPDNLNYSSYGSPRKNDLNTTWFEKLRPDLQGYYASARGKTGVALFESLHDIIAQNNKIIDYNTSKSFMYSTADNISVNGSHGLFDAYSYIFVPGKGGNGSSYKENGDANKDGHPNDFINCEHTWPQSFFNKQLPMVGDLHHLFPTMSVPNNMRGHLPFGMAKGTVVYSTVGGSKLSVVDKTGKNRPLPELQKIINLPYEQKEVIMDKELDAVFEPGDRQKGNTARALLYFYLRYYDQNIRQGEFNKTNFWDSRVSTFINWSEAVDPVDENEIQRHEIVFKVQGNRNPFIDIPGLASLLGEEVLTSH